MAINGVGIVALSVGGLFAYGGIQGKSPLAALQAVIKGDSPATIAQTQGIAIDVSGAGGTNSGGGAGVVADAQSQIGKPYKFAAPGNLATANPPAFDCSGLTGWAYLKQGVKLSHYTVTQYATLKKIPVANAQPGDLIFFGIAPAPHHVGIYIGNGQMIDAPDYGIPVGVRNIHESDLMAKAGQFPGNASVPSSSGAPNSSNPGTRGDQSVTQNQNIARLLLPSYGWNSADEWSALDDLWQGESSWSNVAANASGAYGIPQALPASKMPLAARPASEGGASDPTTQIRWGLSYIKARYGDPIAANNFKHANGYY